MCSTLDTNILPQVTNWSELENLMESFYAHEQAWHLSLKLIQDQHNFQNCTCKKFPSGMTPVFELADTHVVKFYPSFQKETFLKEVSALKYHTGNHIINTPQVIATGEISSWFYIIETKLNGILLEEIWDNLTKEEKAQLCNDLGSILSHFHSTNNNKETTDSESWKSFLVNSIARWKLKNGSKISAELVNTFDEYVASIVTPDIYNVKTSYLHGDIAPVNLMVERSINSIKITGFIDFGNAMIGDPLFDFAAPGVLMGAGKNDRVCALLNAQIYRGDISTSNLRDRLMLYALLHPLGDIKECFKIVGVDQNEKSWKNVASIYWPIRET